jgi:PAS domain S-box-containing protein
MKTEVFMAERKVAEQALLVSEQRYQSLLASTSDYVYTVTMDRGRSVATAHGPGCEAITGFTSREFDADPSLWYRMIHEEDRPAVLAQVARIAKGEVPGPLEHRIIHKDGDVRWLRNVPVPRRDPEGRLVSYNGLISDITDRKRAEEALTTEHNLLRTLIDNLPDCVYAKDTASRFVINNLAHVRVLGAAQPADVVAKTDLDFFPKELALHYRADEEAVLRSGRPLLNREEPVVDSEGNRQWVLTSKVPWRDSQGKIVGLIGISRDITERRHSEEKQRLSEARLQAILDNSAAVIYLKDIQGRYLLVNCLFEALFHVKRKEVVGKSDHDLFPEEMANAFRVNDEKVIAGLAALKFEEVAPHDDGPHTYISVKFPLLDSTGTAYAVCGISTDISERKRGEEQLRRTCTELSQRDERLKLTLQELQASHEELKAYELQLIRAAKLECIGTMAAGVAHEVKNPLQTMLMGLDYLAHNLPASHEGIVLTLHDMRDAVTRAKAILRGLLELAADTKSTSKAEDLNACLERSLWLLQYELGAARIAVVRQLAADLPLVPMDRGKMEQVFINLFINALHAMSQGGTLTVTTRLVQWSEGLASQEPIFRQFKPADSLAVAEVQDTGTGIPEALLPKVFDPFFTTKPAGHGTGLGLAVVKKIMDLHGGAIGIRNAPPGGVRVTLILKLD